MADFLLELLSEEIPARMQARAAADLARLFGARIAEAGLVAESIESQVTPRRLVLIARGLPDGSSPVREERRGPRADAPGPAIDGFLRSTGLTRDQLEEREDRKGGVVLFALVERPGRATEAILADLVPALVRDFPWPKSMRWGAASSEADSLRWVRPLQGIVALLGERIVAFEVAGLSAGAATVGHRFHHPGVITVGGAQDYAEKLRACHVIVDPAERRRLVAEGAVRMAAEAGLTLIEDSGLVEENAGLTEWPVPLLGTFDPDFLDVPREVIQLTMRTNQKYFACADADGRLAPAFVCVANIEAADGGAAIVDGNRKVLAARLADARYFWEQDLKVPLDVQSARLDGIVFHEKLGTLADRVERIAGLARWLADRGHVPGADPDLAERAARLSKADLVTQMVGEFPELQGIIGGHVAAAQDEAGPIAEALRDHYRPAGQNDPVPTAPVTVAVALADKLDTLIAFFSIDERPSGSRDPFALRRAALGVIALIVENGLRFSLRDAIGEHFASLRGDLAGSEDATAAALLDFFADRLKVQQRDAGVRYDLIDAVFALGSEDDLVRLLARVKALQAFVETDEGGDLLVGYRRAANILRKESWEGSSKGKASAHEPESEESALAAALDSEAPRAAAAVAAGDFERAMVALASLRGPVDAFFDRVTVNDADPGKRTARLDLLARMRAAVHQVADFSRIEG